MIDLNENAKSCWSQYYEDNMLSRHLCNGFMLRPVNEYFGHDKEMLKQTMLEHEAIFRKQVYELHRLYRIQRDLMDDCQKKGMYRYSIPSNTSQSNSFSSQMPCEGTTKIWKMSHLPVVKTSYDKAPFATTKDMRSSLNFLNEGSVQSGPISLENGVSLRDGEFNSKLQKSTRRMFDLQLPADVYIDSEDSERSGKKDFADSSSRITVSPSRTCSADPENDVKLTLCTGLGPCCKKDNKIPNSWTQKGLSAQSLADLNKSIKDICFEGAADSTSNHFLGLRNHSEENQGHKLSSKSNTNFLALQSAFSKDGHGDEGSSSSFLYADKGEIRREWPFFNSESEQSRRSLSLFSPSLCDDKFPASSETVQPNLENSHGIALSHQNKTQTWFRQKPTYRIETSGIGTHLATPNNSAVTTAPSIPPSFSILPQTNSLSSASSLVSSQTKPVSSTSHIPVAVQALPCFDGSATLSTQNRISNVAIQNIGTNNEKWQTCRDSRQRAGIEAPSYLNGSFAGFCLDSYLQLSSVTFGKPNHNDTGDSSVYGNSIGHEPQKRFKSLQCTDVKSLHNVNLNQALPNGIEHDVTVQQRTAFCDLEQNLESSSEGISWLRKKPAYNDSIDLKKHASQMELSFVHGHSQLMSSSNIIAPESERKQDKETGPSLCNPQGFTSALKVKEIRMQRNEISANMGSRKILGFPILDEVQQSAVSHQECSLTKNNNCIEKNIYCTDLTCDMKEHCSEKAISVGSLITEKGAENISKSFRNIINLNAEVTSMDDPRLSELSPKSEVTVPLPLPVPRVSVKDATEMNLEVPISQAEVNIMSHQEYMPSSKTDGSQEAECSHDTLAREAAENIVAMSVDVHAHLVEITWDGLPPAQWDTLFWFAEVVSSNTDNARVPRSGGDCGSESSDDDGLDFFEAMTLKLEEIKVDDRCCQPKEFENKKDEPGAASLLLIRPRRGQGRRRRQRRDFQKDVLPGLASLSRHEVTEDLQTIGGLMKASGKNWQTGLTRRNSGRNGLHSQAKGKRQPRSLAVTVSETQVTPPPMHPISTDLEVDGRNMIGWGRTTRRCRRPRCPPGQVITAGLDKTLMFWDMHMENTNIGYTRMGDSDIWSMSLCGFYLLAAVGIAVNVYDLRNLKGPVQSKESSMDFHVKCVRSFSSNQGYAVGSIDGCVALKYFDPTKECEMGCVFRCHPKSKNGRYHLVAVNDIGFHPRYDTFVTGDDDGYAIIWDAQSRKKLFEVSFLFVISDVVCV
ncbi:hypothetical protein COCNU_06G016830 [Cocos nucifera]|uniref:Uncharacterized protein n=1 Tax=Cocos nucifera TaxID=13894 RepID=A0A8K0ICG8_COCNU|nr:hypothetical protein COCNU_06G016830 [Cocos nucifera]